VVLGFINVLAAGNPTVAPYLAGTILGFAIGGFGHVIKAPLMIILGIVVIGITSTLFVIATNPGFS
jgi:hypothetical protein